MQLLGLREQGNPLAQQHGSHLHDEMVDHVVLQQGLQDGVSTHHPDVAIRPQLLHERHRILSDGDETGAVELAMGEDEVLGGGIRRSRIIELGDLGKGAPPHQRDVHARVEFVVTRVLRGPGLVQPVQTVVARSQVSVQRDTSVKVDCHIVSSFRQNVSLNRAHALQPWRPRPSTSACPPKHITSPTPPRTRKIDANNRRGIFNIDTSINIDKVAGVLGFSGKDAVVELLLPIDIVDTRLDFSCLLDKARPSGGKNLFSLGDAPLTLQTKRYVMLHFLNAHAATLKTAKAADPFHVTLIEHAAVVLIALDVGNKPLVAIELESLIGHPRFTTGLHHGVLHHRSKKF